MKEKGVCGERRKKKRERRRWEKKHSIVDHSLCAWKKRQNERKHEEKEK